MNNDRTRPFLLPPIYHGGPLSWMEKYFMGRLKVFRDENTDFNEYLKEVEQSLTECYLI